ncbi:hypothetical protein [Geminocystis sp. NIES-3709]|uniref:hypothetical protein n=1 Tax=Geminocystis sp. NIES-3709 TaxID=1617448 RepID=UPI00082700FB|nr:hypothetical protein [Geminocystis sp. NIES-3709]
MLHGGMMLTIFNLIILSHLAEHIAQMIQLHLLHWARPECLGLLGLWKPYLVRSEFLHYGHALFMLLGIYPMMRWNKWLYATFVLAFYHHLEHFQLLLQAVTKHYWWGFPKPATLPELLIPRIELHFFYNIMVALPMFYGIYLWRKKRDTFKYFS